jgi:uncharacterized protein (TIGR00251 family)
MILLQQTEAGVVLPVRAQPNAKKNGLTGERNGALKVAVTTPPQDGRANAALIEVLAEALGVKRAEVELLRGATSRDKVFLIRGTTVEEMNIRLNQA